MSIIRLRNSKWCNESSIQQILTNEKYIGDALLQKAFTINVLDKKCSSNNCQRPKYYVEGSHEAIISKDVFMRVQSEIARRANLNPDGKRRIHSSRYAQGKGQNLWRFLQVVQLPEGR